MKNLSLQVATTSTDVVSSKISLFRTDCLHYTIITPGCYTVSKKPMLVNSWFLSVLYLPCTFFHSLKKIGMSSFCSCQRKYGFSFLHTSVAFQNQDPSTLGPIQLTILYMKLFYLSCLEFVEEKKFLGILFFPVLSV